MQRQATYVPRAESPPTTSETLIKPLINKEGSYTASDITYRIGFGTGAGRLFPASRTLAHILIRGQGRPWRIDLEAQNPMSAVLPATRAGLVDMMPAIVAALSYSATDIMMKFVFNDGMDVLTLLSLRGVLVVIFFWAWLRAVPPVRWHDNRERWVALGIGASFAILMLTLLEAVALLPVSLAILAYFVYPLLTGIAGSVTGVERLGWRAMVAAMAAFGGLALILGVNFSTLSVAGLACAFIGALARVVSLLVTRAYLPGTDARVTTWYSMAPSAVLFLILAGLYANWHLPHGPVGWASFLGVTFCSTLSTLLIYYSTNRVGPFRTALVMNLEPLCTAIVSVPILGEFFTPLQTAGAAIMITALIAFQVSRR